MKTESLKRAALIAEIVGGTAVVISLVYLAVQVSDNNRLLRSQSHYSALELIQRPTEIMLQSDSLAEALYQCDHSPYEVSESLWPRCANYYGMQVNGWEYTYYQHLDGAVPPELWAGLDGYMSNEVHSKAGFTRFWEEMAHSYGEPFHSYVDERMSSSTDVRHSND